MFFGVISVMTDYVSTLTMKFCVRPSGEVYCIFPFHTLITWTLGERQRLEIHDPGRESEAWGSCARGGAGERASEKHLRPENWSDPESGMKNGNWVAIECVFDAINITFNCMKNGRNSFGDLFFPKIQEWLLNFLSLTSPSSATLRCRMVTYILSLHYQEINCHFIVTRCLSQRITHPDKLLSLPFRLLWRFLIVEHRQTRRGGELHSHGWRGGGGGRAQEFWEFRTKIKFKCQQPPLLLGFWEWIWGSP